MNLRGAASRNPGLLQVVLELPAPGRVAEVAERLRLDLADALAGDVELLADLLESPGAAVLQPKPELEHPPLTTGQRVEDRLDLLLEELMRGRLRRRERTPVLDEVAEVGVLLLADRRLQRHRLLGDLDDLADLLRGDLDLLALGHRLGDLLDRRPATQLLGGLPRDAGGPVDRLDHMDRGADRAGPGGAGPGDGLADPPRGIGRELEALLEVELLDRPDEADVALLDEVQERHPAADVLLGDRDDEPEVGRGQLLAGVAPDPDELALAVGQLGRLRDVGVVAHGLEEVGVAAGVDPALEGREGHPVAGPVVDRPEADVVARIEVAVVDGKVGPVEEAQEGLGRRLVAPALERRVVLGEVLAGLLEELGRALRLDVATGLDEVEIGRRHEQVAGPVPRDRVADEAVGLLAERQAVLRLEGPGLRFGVVGRPLVERDEALPGLLGELLTELDRLGQDDLFLGRQEGDLADLLEVHPDRVVDPDHVGREGLELLGRRLLELGGIQLGGSIRGQADPGRGHLGVLRDDLDGGVVRVVVGGGHGGGEGVVVLVVGIDVIVDDHGPETGELGLLEIGLAPPGAGEDGFDELLVERVDGHGGTYLREGLTRRRVWSRRRWSDRRWSLMAWISWRWRPAASTSPACSASARASWMNSWRSSRARTSRSMTRRSTS